ncbi:MAG TPA: hypothetical protein DDZ82_09395 [Rhodobacteraceae bacterium]|nr:hypothetical protein [Paracoccaceae bacterium]
MGHEPTFFWIRLDLFTPCQRQIWFQALSALSAESVMLVTQSQQFYPNAGAGGLANALDETRCALSRFLNVSY